MLNNVLTFLSTQHRHARDFHESLSGEATITQTSNGEWVVQFCGQHYGEKTTYFARLPDGRVVRRRSKRPLLGVVATIYSSALIDEVRGGIWAEAVREYHLAQGTAKLPKPEVRSTHWDAASNIVSSFAGSDEYAAHVVRERKLTRVWDDFSWRYSMHSASAYARQLSMESRWESVVALNVVGGN